MSCCLCPQADFSCITTLFAMYLLLCSIDVLKQAPQSAARKPSRGVGSLLILFSLHCYLLFPPCYVASSNYFCIAHLPPDFNIKFVVFTQSMQVCPWWTSALTHTKANLRPACQHIKKPKWYNATSVRINTFCEEITETESRATF